MSKRRRQYTREFKIEAAKLSYNSDKPVEQIAKDLGVSQSSLNRWRSEYRADPDQAFPSALIHEPVRSSSQLSQRVGGRCGREASPEVERDAVIEQRRCVIDRVLLQVVRQIEPAIIG